jgi:hypothetical protein
MKKSDFWPKADISIPIWLLNQIFCSVYSLYLYLNYHRRFFQISFLTSEKSKTLFFDIFDEKLFGDNLY